jgi:hypothetical protein
VKKWDFGGKNCLNVNSNLSIDSLNLRILKPILMLFQGFCSFVSLVVGLWVVSLVCSAQTQPAFENTEWGSVGNRGVFDSVAALTFDGSGNLYIGGRFSQVEDFQAGYVAKWDGHSWLPMGTGVSYYVTALAALGSNIYAGQNYGKSKWDGNAWSWVQPDLDGGVSALTVVSNNLFAGGDFLASGQCGLKPYCDVGRDFVVAARFWIRR